MTKKKIFVEPSPENIRVALTHIDPTDQDRWISVGMGIKSALGEPGFDLWDSWSQGASNYSEQAAKARWKSFKSTGRGVGIGTVFDLAKQAGWEPSENMQAPPMDPVEKARIEAERKAQAEAARKAKEAKDEERAMEAQRRFKAGFDEGECTYLDRKQIKAHGVRFGRISSQILDKAGIQGQPSSLLIPLCDIDGKQWSLQTIFPFKWRPTDESPPTDKIVLKDSRKSGSMHWLCKPKTVPATQHGDIQGAPSAMESGWILIAEGYATAATGYEAVNLPTAMVVDSGNMAKVVQAVHRAYPDHRIMILADDDHGTLRKTGKNPGLTAAYTAAKAVGGYWVSPSGLQAGESDFNDLHVRAGLEVVREQILQALANPMNQKPAHIVDAEGDADGGAGQGALNGSATPTAEKATANTSKKPKVQKTIGGRFKVNEDGVFFHGVDENGEAKRPVKVCSALYVRGLTRDANDSCWGYLLEWADPLGKLHTWSMPRRMLAGDGAAYREALLDMGLTISPGAAPKNLLHQYIAETNTDTVYRCVEQVGWYENQFVLPDRTYGHGEEQVIYQCEVLRKNLFETKGTSTAWRESVATLAVGNSRLTFAISCAFAGPLLNPTGVESGGFHFTGNSSSGKSTTINVASSVWGSPEFKRGWRATDNALEAVAAAHSDTLLALDELGQADSRTVGDTAYMLANGAGRERMSSRVALRPALRWRVLFVSTGEQPLKEKMAEVGKKTQAGQELRVADIPFATEGGIGGFETIHEFTQAAEFAKALSHEAARNYGHPGREFLEHLCKSTHSVTQQVSETVNKLVRDWVPGEAVGQVFRVAQRFALVATAGEYATAWGLTGWDQGDSEWAAKICFDAWLDKRGTIELSEHRDMLEAVRAFLSTHNARFQWWHRVNDDHAPNVLYRAGFKKRISATGKAIETHVDEFREHGDKVGPEDNEAITLEYYILPGVFKEEVSKGFDPRAVATLLYDKGFLEPGEAPANGGRPRVDKKVRLPGLGSTRCYVIKPNIFIEE